MEIIVKGTGTDFFTPDQVVLNLTFNEKAQNYNVALINGVNNVQKFIQEILLKNDFSTDDMKTRNFVIKENKRYDETSRKYFFDGFSFNQSATLKFDYNKEKLANIMEQLSKLDGAPNCLINFSVKNEKECRKKVLSQAYSEAETQAHTIAEAAGKTLKQCMKVDFEPFSTKYISNSRLGSETVYKSALCSPDITSKLINTFTPEDITISETLYCLWIAE